MAITATMALAMESQRTRVREASMARLLHELRDFMRAYPREVDVKVLDLDLVWVSGIGDGGPEKAILDAINANPELWADALPEDVVIVPRRLLKSTTALDDSMIDALNHHGMDMVLRKACVLRHAKEEAERLKRRLR